MKRKLIPPFLMLFMGAIASIIMCSMHYETKAMLLILLGVLVGFYIIGYLLKIMLDIFDKQNKEKLAEEKIVTTEKAVADIGEGQVNSED